ncbi:uncharacterized protein LOC122267911 [Penaeus japonicus]|uniref:uncharacterized protein LOC122267911 n=1 Tax=Penaeus japonicus TaxID=27405 RepID=UPI001C70BF78|nr:uncharacterized protein LOC122267911 [Penaeus japonicus]
MPYNSFAMELWSLVLLVAFQSTWHAGARAEEGLFFQPENQLTTESHATARLGPSSETLSDLTVCTWVKVQYFRDSASYLCSYAVTDQKNNELNFGIKSTRVFIAIGGKYLYGDGARLYPDEWYHVCFVANSENSTGTFYLNGKKNGVKSLPRQCILLNGSLVLGQESDKVGGGFQALQSFSGIISDFNLYSRSLQETEIKDLAECSRQVPEGDVVSWSSTEWQVEGPVIRVNLTQNDLCPPRRFRFTVFPRRSKEKAARSLCRNLKSTLATPRSAEENAALFEQAAHFTSVCQPPNHATGFLWVGAKRDGDQWVDTEGTGLNYTNFGDWSMGDYRCASYLLPRYRGKWTDVPCGRYTFCAACEEPRPVALRIRGFCANDYKDTMFRLDTDPATNLPAFRGFTKYQIKYGEDRKWHLLNMWTSETEATLFSHDASLPLGLHSWRITSNSDICGKQEGSTHLLALTACRDNEYSCRDGTCISLEKRCDLRVDCPDNSDETSCDKLVPPQDYLLQLPPPGITPGPLGLNLSIAIKGFSEVNIRDMVLKVDFSTTVTWIDQRLKYKNLKVLPEFNYIDPSSVWKPEVDLDNAIFPDIHRTSAVINALKASQSEPDDATVAVNDEFYEGIKNPLSLSQKVNAPFTCNMDLRMFPFDTQHCQMHLRIASTRENFLRWKQLEVVYEGEVTTSEYVIGRMTIDHKSTNNYSVAVVGFVFSRQYSYYMTSAFLPSIMLMLVGYASLFCKRENRDLRVMMSLTTLLVLYSLYQQVEADLPSTSYTKAIDVWFFFAISFIFTQVILHVAIDVRVPLPTRFPKPTTVLPINEIPSKMFPSTSCWRPLNAARVFYAILFALFMVVFWMVVLKFNGTENILGL